MPGGTEQARISGDGSAVVFTAHSDAIPPAAGTTGDFVYRAATTSVDTFANLVGRNAHEPTIDATGDTFAFVDDDECDGMPAIIAGTLDQNFYYAAAGTILTDRRVGYIADPEISADGSRVTWTTTVPEYDFAAPAAELDAPVVRTQEIGWSDSRPTVDCSGLIPDWSDVAEGSEASVSASARTVAFSAPAPAGSTVFAIDTHRHEGLSVSSTQGQLVTPGYHVVHRDGRDPAHLAARLQLHHRERADLPAADLPAAHLPAPDLSAADLPAAHLGLADLPAADLPAARSTSCRSTSSSSRAGGRRCWPTPPSKGSCSRASAWPRSSSGPSRPSRAGRPRRRPSEQRLTASRASPSETSTSTAAR